MRGTLATATSYRSPPPRSSPSPHPLGPPIPSLCPAPRCALHFPLPYELRSTYGTERDVAPIEILGFTAAALGAGALYPQVRQSWRTRSTGDLNLRALLTIAVSIVLFVSYGIAIGSPSVITANIVAGVMILSLAYLKIRHG